MKKSIALLCAITMLVSIIPAFAANSDTPLKTQTQLQNQVKTQDSNCTTNQARDQNKTESQLQKQLKVKDCNCLAVKKQDQNKTQLQKKLKVKAKTTVKVQQKTRKQIKKQSVNTVKKQDQTQKRLKNGLCKAI